jgi:hypothetical protein
LAIKDSSLMKLAQGANIIWRMITGRLEWWKKFLYKKYFSVNHRRCIDGPLDNK